MPLLRKQPFLKVKPPPDLRPDDEVFHCTMTNEIFKTYEEFFERTILCNSLVWSCGITGRSGLTYAEAVESERAAEKRLATFDLALQKPLLFLVTLTRKSRFLELCDDIFLFASDRFFIGETVDVIIGRQTMPAVILRVVAPPRTVPSKTNGEVIVIDEDSEPEDEERQLPAAGEMMYVVGLTSNTNKRVMVKAMQISRKKGAYNRDRNKLFLKHKCQSVNGLWCVKEAVKQKMLLTGAKFEDFFAGPRPNFAVSEKRKSGAKQPCTGSPTVCTSSSSSPKPTTSSRSSPAASQSLNHSSRPSPTASQSLNHLPRSSPSVSQSQNHLSRPHLAASQTVNHSSRPSAAASQTLKNSYRPSPAASQSMVNHQSSASPGVFGSRQEMVAGAKMAMQKAREQAERKSAQEAMLAAHRQTLRQQERLEKLAKQLAIRKKFEEEKQRMKEEKERARVEKEKERLKKMEEKRLKMQQLREWNRPREDMECDDLKPLPELKELKTRIPVQLFADALMVLEYMTAFKSVFDFEQFFPKGFSWEHIEAAVMESDQQGPLCDLLQMLLCSLFNLQEAEAGEVQAEAAEEMLEECEKKAATLNMGDDENGEDDDQISNNELIRSAILSAQFSPLTFGVPLKEMTLDQYTLTEILRLHLMSSGADANQKNARFRYQQRGGYSALDDPGLELRKQESALMKKMQIGNVFDLAPEEKLRLLTTLVQQVMTYAAVRDIVEDSYDKLRVKKYDLKILQWNEARRVREMMGAMYRRDMDEKVKEQEFRMKTIARAAQIKQAIDSGLEPPSLPPLEDPRLTPEQKQQREEEEREQEVKKKEEYAKRDLEVQKEIMELQQINAIYPMGRDRIYRRYWYFSSLPAILVEDYELFVPSSSAKAGDQVPSAKSHEGDGQVGKVKQENGEGSLESSHTLGDSSKGSSSLTSEGKADAKQAEQSQEDSNSDSSESKQTGEQSQEQSNREQTGEQSQEQSNGEQTGEQSQEQSNGDSSESKQTGEQSQEQENGDSSESKQTGEQSQEQENGDSSESKQTAEQSLEQSNGDLSESGQTEQGSNSGDVTDAKKAEESGEQSRGEVCDTKPTEQSQEQTNGSTTNTNTEQKQTEDTVSDSKPAEQGQTVGDMSDAGQSEPAQKQPRWYVVDSKPCLQQLMAALNPRGFRENALHNMLQDYQRLLDMTIESCPVDTLCESGSSEENQRERSAGQSTTPTRKVMGSTKGDAASETMELTLRDGLLDMEGRIYAGGLGAIRVKDRAAWRAALENGGYSPLTDEAPFARVHSPKKTKVDTKAVRSAYIPEEVVARDLAHAMVQMARGVEPRYLKPPFGEADRRSLNSKEEKTEHQRRAIYDRWEESALGTTSLSQVFLHLAALDRCIKWNRSTLKLRCRICRRMRDDDKMLLCDKCDRGHHIYCLKPPLTKIPAGDWFCHTCRPKVSAPAPRKRRRNFEEDEEEEESMEFENSVEEASDDEGGEQDTDSEEEADDVPNEDICAKCHEDGILILCDVCPRSFHLHCAQPPLKKVPKGKWMCHVCVDGGQRGKNKAKGKQDSARKGSPNTPSSGRKSDKSRLSGSRQQTPRNSPTPSSGRKKQGSSQEVASRGQSQKSKTTPKSQSQSAGSPSKQQTPKSWGNTKGQLKRKSSSMSNHPDADEQESDSSTPEEQMQAAETLLEDLMEHKEAWPFLEPVDKKVAPDYYEVIETPMDLSTIRSKLQQHSYSSAAQLLNDVRLIFTNCIQYNLSSAPVYQAGQALNKYFQSRVRALGLQSSEKSGSSPGKKQRR